MSFYNIIIAINLSVYNKNRLFIQFLYRENLK